MAWTGNVYWIPRKYQDYVSNESFVSGNIKVADLNSSSKGWRFYKFLSKDALTIKDKNMQPHSEFGYEYLFALAVSDANKLVILTQISAVLDKLKQDRVLKNILSVSNAVQYEIDGFVSFFFEQYNRHIASSEQYTHEVLQLRVITTEAKLREIGHRVDSISLSGDDLITSKIFRDTVYDSYFTSTTISLIRSPSIKVQIRSNGKILTSNISPRSFDKITKILSILRKYRFVTEELV